MPHTGNIVRAIPCFATTGAAEWRTEPGIVLGQLNNRNGVYTVQFATGLEHAFHPDNFETVHELHTAEARAIHEAYPQHQGHDYYWYCSQRNVEPFRTEEKLLALGMIDLEPDLEPEQLDAMLNERAWAQAYYEEVPLPYAQWQRGDVVRRINGNYDYDGGTITDGTELRVLQVDVPDERVDVEHLTGAAVGSMDPENLVFVRRPTPMPIPAAAPLSWQQWLPGDVLRRSENYGPTFEQDEEATVVANEGNYLQVRRLHTVDEGMPSRHWSHENFTWVRRPETATATPRAPQVGDRVRVVVSEDGHLEGTMYLGWEGVLQNTIESTHSAVRIMRDSGTLVSFYPKNLELVTAAVAVLAEDLRAVPASEWRVGDTVRLVAATQEVSHGVVGGEYLITTEPGGSYINAYRDGGNWAIPIADLVLVCRAGTPAPALPEPPNGLPRNTDIGARVMVTVTGKAGSINGPIGRSYKVFVDGESAYRLYTADALQPVTQEPTPPPLPKAFSSCWLSCDGLTKEEVAEFVQHVTRTTTIHDGTKNKTSYGGNHYGDTETGPKIGGDGKRGGLYYNNRSIIYYHGNGDVCAQGLLTRDWNQVLNVLRQRHGRLLIKPPIAAAPTKNHGLAKLPHYFIVEQTDTPANTLEHRNLILVRNGFSGYMGTYTLFSGNHAIGTSLKGAAEAFQRKHACVWLQSKQDSLLLSHLFITHKLMLTTSAAQQRFALDVDASGPHLIVAFKAFMASIGYRQENADKTSGPYILLNGGNLFANQPATWQYSERPDRRSAIINLAEPAASPGATGMSGKSGWEKLGERLANRGVALPVLDAEDLDRSPIAGDRVCLVFNDVQDGYPETDADLRSHTCGQQYTVQRLISGNLCLLTETGLCLHADRLQVLETPRGFQNGDQVQMEAAYGEHLAVNQVLTLMNGMLVAADNTAYAVPASYYTFVTPALLTQNLLRRYDITLPCVVLVSNPDLMDHGNEVILTTAWPLNNQELAFWTEDAEEKDSWLTRADFQVVAASSVPDLFQPAWRVLKGATRETTAVQIGDVLISLAQLEDALIGA